MNTEPHSVQATLCALLQYYMDRGDAVLSLLANRLDWDAEILLRTCYECASKILFIALSPQNERANLVWEFWIPLGEVSDRKTARKADFAERAASHTNEYVRDVFGTLRDPRMIRNRLGLNKKDRRSLEQKWSFSELIESLADLPLGNKRLSDVRSLLHSYGMASHLAHADSTAMDLMADRALRDPGELRLLRDSHAARIASDLIVFGSFCIHVASAALGLRDLTLSDLGEQANEVSDMTSKIQDEFFTSQRTFYESMRATSGKSEPRASGE